MQHHHATMQHTPCSPQTVPHPHAIAPLALSRHTLTPITCPPPLSAHPRPLGTPSTISCHTHAIPMPPIHSAVDDADDTTLTRSRGRHARFVPLASPSRSLSRSSSRPHAPPPRPDHRVPERHLLVPSSPRAAKTRSRLIQPSAVHFWVLRSRLISRLRGGGVSNVHGVQQPGARAPRLSELARVRLPTLPVPFPLFRALDPTSSSSRPFSASLLLLTF